MKKNNQTPQAPTLDLRIEAPIEHYTLMVAVGTIIEDYSGTYQCVACGTAGSAAGTDPHAVHPCTGCDAPWVLCRIMCCDGKDRRDKTDVHLIKLRNHE